MELELILKNRSMKIFTIIKHLVVPLFCITGLSFTQQKISDAQINEIIKKEVDNGRCPSIVVGILDENGKHVIAYGRSNKESGSKPDGNTLYEIGSITKVFTSLLLEEMFERSELSVNDPISKFLPKNVNLPMKDEKEIKLLDLSTQTSGLPRMPNNFTPKDYGNPFADYTPEKLYEFLSSYKLTRSIGEKYEYSNLGVGLLGHILTLKAGTDYETLLQKRICEPLNMKSTIILITPELKQRLAVGYNENGKPVKNWDFSALTGCGAIKSTVNDLLIFAEANLGLIKTSLSNAMEEIQQIKHNTTVPDLYIGMGWHVWTRFDKAIIWHNGGTGGYRTFIGLDKEDKKAVVVLSNGINGVDDIGLHLLDNRFNLTQYGKK
jgi:D-alanyl-D-alanine-carboxypeptidase/D-alanyl-D-alanine-endopeptidase